MMKPTQDLSREDIASCHRIVIGGTQRNGLAMALMRPALIEIPNILTESSSYPLVKRDDIKNFLHSSIDESRAVDIVLNGGDISIHRANLIHGSEPNLGSKWRLSFVINSFSTHTHIENQGRPAYLLRGNSVSGSNEYSAFPKFVDGVHTPFRGHEQWR